MRSSSKTASFYDHPGSRPLAGTRIRSEDEQVLYLLGKIKSLLSHPIVWMELPWLPYYPSQEELSNDVYELETISVSERDQISMRLFLINTYDRYLYECEKDRKAEYSTSPHYRVFNYIKTGNHEEIEMIFESMFLHYSLGQLEAPLGYPYGTEEFDVFRSKIMSVCIAAGDLLTRQIINPEKSWYKQISLAKLHFVLLAKNFRAVVENNQIFYLGENRP